MPEIEWWVRLHRLLVIVKILPLGKTLLSTRKNMLNSTNKLAGLNLVTSNKLEPYVPKMKVRSDLMITDKGRAEMDKWLLDFFGEEPNIMRMGDTLIMHPAILHMIKAKVHQDATITDTLNIF